MNCLVRFHKSIEIHRLLRHAEVFKVRTETQGVLSFYASPRTVYMH